MLAVVDNRHHGATAAAFAIEAAVHFGIEQAARGTRERRACFPASFTSNTLLIGALRQVPYATAERIVSKVRHTPTPSANAPHAAHTSLALFRCCPTRMCCRSSASPCSSAWGRGGELVLLRRLPPPARADACYAETAPSRGLRCWSGCTSTAQVSHTVVHGMLRGG